MKQYNTQQKKKIVKIISKTKNKKIINKIVEIRNKYKYGKVKIRMHSALNYDTPMLYFKKLSNT